ncbi:MAG: glycosyltransferase family 2 protein [Planctomycetota bacterium]|nr:glycosyltransferase family 2 protein [Planctomycetota bacterium]
MIDGQRVFVVLPAYNAATTLEKTYGEIPRDIVDEVILVDDASPDDTVAVARRVGIRHVVVHPRNRGYGGNQKSCYRKALELGADIVVMVHPDYQYTPRLITAMASLIATGLYDVVLGSRILGVGALRGGMPLYKYVSNRVLTGVQNILMNYKLSEYHTGYRAFSRRLLESLPLEENSDDFVFDNEMLTQAVSFDYQIAEVSCPTLYDAESSSISFFRSVKYGFGVLWTALRFRLQRMGVCRFAFLDPTGRRISIAPPEESAETEEVEEIELVG